MTNHFSLVVDESVVVVMKKKTYRMGEQNTPENKNCGKKKHYTHTHEHIHVWPRNGRAVKSEFDTKTL